MRKDTTEAKETSTTTIYHPSLLRYFLYIAGTSLVILFVLAWPFWRGDNFLERVVILWVAHVVVQLFFRFGIEMVSDKMIILSAGIIAGPPIKQEDYTELQITEIDCAATNQYSFWQSLGDRTTIYDQHGSFIHINCFYFAPRQLQALYRSIGCEYPVSVWHRMELAMAKLLKQS